MSQNVTAHVTYSLLFFNTITTSPSYICNVNLKIKTMKSRNFLTALFMLMGIWAIAQDLTLTNPTGLNEPYEVQPGTDVTVTWSYYNEQPTVMLTYDQDPGNVDDNQYTLDADWTQHTSGWTDNGDGTFSFNINVNEPIWIWGAYESFNGYAYSNIISIGIASPAEANFDDGLLCPGGTDTELLSIADTFDTYQWYHEGVIISGATSETYNATETGSYYVVVNDNGTSYQSNQLIIDELSLAFTGALDQVNNQITLTAESGMDSYQWYSGIDLSNMTPITGATNIDFTADITGTLTYYYVEGTLGTCDISTDARPISSDIFEPAVISVNADTNSYGNVCEGTTIILSIDNSITNYDWYKNGVHTYGNHTISITNSYKTGTYYVINVPDEWPEVTVQSASVNAEYFDIIEPVLSGATNNSYHCAGDAISITLSDEGYEYHWYAHTTYTYNDTDEVVVPSSVYSFTFENAVNISVVAEYQGCENDKKITLKDYANVPMGVGIDNYNQRYLCTDSVANLKLTSNASNFENYQWYKQNGNTWDEISGATNTTYDAPDSGYYKISGTHVECPSAYIESSPYHVLEYNERPMYVSTYPYSGEICLGDSARLTLSGTNWNNIQWLEGDIQMTQNDGYQIFYLPMANSDTTRYYVTHYNKYIVKAKHSSCPNGLKLTSDTLEIRSKFIPEIEMINDNPVDEMKLTLLDSAKTYLFCEDEPVHMATDSGYVSYQWYFDNYGYYNQEDWSIGDSILGATTDSLTIEAGLQWIRVAAEDNTGCIGVSDPILLNTRAYQSPVVLSHFNSELCEGDSVAIELAFPGDWGEFVWFKNTIEIPNSDNDTLWVTEPGSYIIGAYPNDCPDMLYTSGTGANIHYFEVQIVEDIDDDGNEYFYAWPWGNAYQLQWYFNGQPIDGTQINSTSIIYKDSLTESGVLTCELVNGMPCTVTDSTNFVFTGIEDYNFGETKELRIYPNPTNGIINIDGLDIDKAERVSIYNTVGNRIMSQEISSNFMSLALYNVPAGMYIIKIENKDGSIETYKVNKK